MEGTILEIQRMSTEDGPGIRTTVFVKGCPLRCGWCHNPESIAPGPELVWEEWKCIGCGGCIQACPEGALHRSAEGIVIDRQRCTACGACVDECPSTAMRLLGTTWDVDALVAELVKDESYFASSGGGVTISGGDPALQPAFTSALLDALRDRGVHTALDTSGAVKEETLLGLASRADLVLYDLKHMDSETHKAHTGRPSERIHTNLRALVAMMTAHGRPAAIWIRTPLIPGATTDEASLRAIGAFVATLGDAVARWELPAFNNLCRDQYRRLGRTWQYADTPLMTRAELDAIEALVRTTGVDPQKVSVTGASAPHTTRSTP